MQVTSHGREDGDPAAGAQRGRDRLDGDIGHSEEDAGRGAEHHAVVLVRVELLREDEEGAEREQGRLEGDHADGGVARVAAVVRQRDGEQHEAEGGEADARPLARADRAAEVALRQHGEEDESAGDDGLDDRERRHGEGGDVEDPRAERHEHADREPLGAEQSDGAGDRVLQAYVRRGACATMLEQEADVRRERAEDGKKNSELKHRLNSEKSLGLRRGVLSPTAVRAIGLQASLLNRPFGQS